MYEICVFKIPFSDWCGNRVASKGSNAENPLLEDDAGVSGDQKIEQVTPELLALGNDNRSIAVRGLRKVFKTTDDNDRIAVASLNMDIYEGQCTVLLGHNGAGAMATKSYDTCICSICIYMFIFLFSLYMFIYM